MGNKIITVSIIGLGGREIIEILEKKKSKG